MCCNCCSVRQQKIWVFSIGSVLGAIGIVLTAGWPKMSESIINSMLPLGPNSVLYNKWVVTPLPIYLNFYLFNWTNAHEANNPNVKPHYEENGPYSFREIKVKEDLEWDYQNNTVTFFGTRSWIFDESLSKGSLDDIIILPNIAVVGASEFMRKWPRLVQKIVNFALNREGGNLILKEKAINWIFTGFYDDLFDFVWRMHSPLIPIKSNIFAWFYGRNNSKEADGTFTVHTGKGDLKQMGDLKRWKGNAYTGLWDDECGKVNGSTGELWAPSKSWHDSVSIFIPDAARFINLFPQDNLTYRGIEAWRYTSTDQTFDNGYVAPDTKCFCLKNRVCPKNGMVDFSPVAFKAPVYLSHGHFHMTDETYRENTTGLKPDPEKHGFSLIMEPTLGIPLTVDGSVLISLLVRSDNFVDLTKDLAYDHYAPLFGAQIKADIDDDLLRLVKLVLNIGPIGQYVGIGLIVVGVIMIAVGIWLTLTHKWRGDAPKEKQHLENVEKPRVSTIQQQETTTNTTDSNNL